MSPFDSARVAGAIRLTASLLKDEAIMGGRVFVLLEPLIKRFHVSSWGYRMALLIFVYRSLT